MLDIGVSLKGAELGATKLDSYTYLDKDLITLLDPQNSRDVFGGGELTCIHLDMGEIGCNANVSLVDSVPSYHVC